jgi:cell wall-associated NlpC family hydrolase
MSKIQEFEKKYLGQKVRDGQCVALVRQYAEECFGIPHTASVEGAMDLWLTRNSNPLIRKYFDVVEGRPQEGDIVFFIQTLSNKYGHVAIVLEDCGDGFNCIEQDGFKLDGVKTAFWTWTRYAGAFRPKAV